MAVNPDRATGTSSSGLCSLLGSFEPLPFMTYGVCLHEAILVSMQPMQERLMVLALGHWECFTLPELATATPRTLNPEFRASRTKAQQSV